MTTTSMNGSATSAGSSSSPATAAAGGAREVVARSPLPTRQRRPGLAAVGLIVVLGMGAVFGWLYTTAGEKTPVVVMAREVPVGQVIERADLSTVDVAGSVTAIAGANLTSAVGQRAAVGLIPGTLLQRGMLTSGDPIPTGQVQVGVALKAGQLPADGVTAGDKVAVLRLGTTTPGAAQAAASTAATAPVVLADAADGVFGARGSHADRRQFGDPGGDHRSGPGDRGGQQHGKRCPDQGSVVMIVAVCSDKGAAGGTTLAVALGMVWPGQRSVVEADVAGGDLALRVRSESGEFLTPTPSLASLSTAARMGTADPAVHCAADVSAGAGHGRARRRRGGTARSAARGRWWPPASLNGQGRRSLISGGWTLGSRVFRWRSQRRWRCW